LTLLLVVVVFPGVLLLFFLVRVRVLVRVPGGLPGGDATMVGSLLEKMDLRLTTKHVSGTVVVVGVVSRAIAWNATDASLDDSVDGIFGGDVLAVRVRPIAWRAIGASLVYTVFCGGDIRDGLVVCLCCISLFREEQRLLEE